MSTKFGLHIDFDLLKAAISTNAKPEIVLSVRGCHLDKAIYTTLFHHKYDMVVEKQAKKQAISKKEKYT